jgi:hypothetical protein
MSLDQSTNDTQTQKTLGVFVMAEERLTRKQDNFYAKLKFAEEKLNALYQAYHQQKEATKVSRALALVDRPCELCCRRCFLLERCCVCNQIVTLPCRHRIVVLIHYKEYRRQFFSSNSLLLFCFCVRTLTYFFYRTSNTAKLISLGIKGQHRFKTSALT